MPARNHQLGSIPGHAEAKSGNHQIGNTVEDQLEFFRNEHDQNVKAEMIAFPDTDGGTKKDEPSHQDDGGWLAPDDGIIEDVADEHLSGDENGHQDQSGTGQPKRELREQLHHLCDGFHEILHVSLRTHGTAPDAGIPGLKTKWLFMVSHYRQEAASRH